MSQANRSYIVASKRAAVTYELDNSTGKLIAQIAPGGTANVVSDMASYLNVNWIASAMTVEDKQVAKDYPDGFELGFNSTSYARPIKIFFLSHEQEVFDDMQNIICADILWHSNNALWDSWISPNFNARTNLAWGGFEKFSYQFASAIEKNLSNEPGAHILLHDYQMLLVPEIIRGKGIENPLLLFIHIPWPEPDYWRMLPRYMRESLVSSALSSSVIAFFCDRWCLNFLRGVKDIFPLAEVDYDQKTVQYKGRITKIENMPLGYSQQALDSRAGYVPKELEKWLNGRPYIMHSGRTDPMKNAHRAIIAYREAALQNEKVRQHCLLIRTNPNRLNVDDNSKYLQMLYAEAESTNKLLGDEVVIVVCENDVKATIGCLSHADIILINSTIDGQNLTVFEAALTNLKDAPLILSERTGAAEIMSDGCLIINPFDILELVNTLIFACGLSRSERYIRASLCRELAKPCELKNWVDQQISTLSNTE
ncbi:MAG: trehalose-6-phosphate synthase [Formosimonas sp.]